MGSKFYGKKKAVSDSELDSMLSAALDTVEPIAFDQELEVATPEEVVVDDKKVLHIAYNTYYDSAMKKFALITIQYNPYDNSTSFLKKEYIADNIAVALYKLNGIVTNKLVRGEDSI